MRHIILLAACTLAAYMPLPRLLAAASSGQLPGRVATTGVYRPDGEYERLVKGRLEEAGVHLRVLGGVFDWIPPPGARIDVWGRMRADSSGPYLEFWNGRLHGDASRAPQPTPPLAPGKEVRLMVRLRLVGAHPVTWWTAETEDKVLLRITSIPGLPPSGLIAWIDAEVQQLTSSGPVIRVRSWEPVPWAPPPPPGG